MPHIKNFGEEPAFENELQCKVACIDSTHRMKIHPRTTLRSDHVTFPTLLNIAFSFVNSGRFTGANQA